MVLLMKIWILLMFYTGFEGIIVNCTWWGKMSQSLWRSILCLKIWCVPVIYWTSKGKVIDQLLLCILLFCSILKLLLLYAVSNLSLVAEVMTFLCPLDFGWFFQWPLYRDFQWLWLLLTLTLWPCTRHSIAILMRSCRFGFLAITSIDGCYLYIIIHNCILHVTWL